MITMWALSICAVTLVHRNANDAGNVYLVGFDRVMSVYSLGRNAISAGKVSVSNQITEILGVGGKVYALSNSSLSEVNKQADVSDSLGYRLSVSVDNGQVTVTTLSQPSILNSDECNLFDYKDDNNRLRIWGGEDRFLAAYSHNGVKGLSKISGPPIGVYVIGKQFCIQSAGPAIYTGTFGDKQLRKIPWADEVAYSPSGPVFVGHFTMKDDVSYTCVKDARGNKLAVVQGDWSISTIDPKRGILGLRTTNRHFGEPFYSSFNGKVRSFEGKYAAAVDDRWSLVFKTIL